MFTDPSVGRDQAAAWAWVASNLGRPANSGFEVAQEAVLRLPGPFKKHSWPNDDCPFRRIRKQTPLRPEREAEKSGSETSCWPEPGMRVLHGAWFWMLDTWRFKLAGPTDPSSPGRKILYDLSSAPPEPEIRLWALISGSSQHQPSGRGLKVAIAGIEISA